VKLMRSQTREEKAALANELAIHCKFSHENCLRMIGYFATRTSVGIVMERCAGNLHDVSLSRRMPLAEALRTALGIARGMLHLHEKRVSHRDLKSANVLLDARGVPKVADFGLSKADTASVRGFGVGFAVGLCFFFFFLKNHFCLCHPLSVFCLFNTLKKPVFFLFFYIPLPTFST
jgi:serine/threonine protein kinase